MLSSCDRQTPETSSPPVKSMVQAATTPGAGGHRRRTDAVSCRPSACASCVKGWEGKRECWPRPHIGGELQLLYDRFNSFPGFWGTRGKGGRCAVEPLREMARGPLVLQRNAYCLAWPCCPDEAMEGPCKIWLQPSRGKGGAVESLKGWMDGSHLGSRFRKRCGSFTRLAGQGWRRRNAE